MYYCGYEFYKFVNFQDLFSQLFDVNREVIRVAFEVNYLLKDIEEVLLFLEEMSDFVDLSHLVKLREKVS